MNLHRLDNTSFWEMSAHLRLYHNQLQDLLQALIDNSEVAYKL